MALPKTRSGDEEVSPWSRIQKRGAECLGSRFGGEEPLDIALLLQLELAK